MSTKLAATLRRRLIAADDHCCAYCQTCSANTGQPLTLDHILPTSQGGGSTFDNLCFACRQCNEFKGAHRSGVDPLTGTSVPLFHPRHDHWAEHFTWDGSNSRIVGVTSIGRATVIALNLNNNVVVQARRRWVAVGWHPPQE